jgi:hypothetical protein
MKKPRGDAKLKTLPDALQEKLFQYLRRHTAEKTVQWLKEEHAVATSAGALSVFFSWYPRSCTLRTAARTSDELAAQLKKMPELKLAAADAARIAQVNFEIQAAQDRDPALFAALRKGELETARLQLEREKFEESKKADWEKGLDALLDEIKGNPEALRHFEAMKAALK